MSFTGANGKKIKCQFCPYTTFSRQHLDRHLAGAHESGGGKNNQYFCRKCSFSCNSMDNLRKHILKTTKHPESHVYDCHLCSFKNNSRLDFKNHLIRIHPNEKANIVVDEYFKQHNGTIKSQNNWKKEFWNPPIYNILCWVAWTMGQTNRQPRVWCSKYYFFLYFL